MLWQRFFLIMCPLWSPNVVIRLKKAVYMYRTRGIKNTNEMIVIYLRQFPPRKYGSGHSVFMYFIWDEAPLRRLYMESGVLENGRLAYLTLWEQQRQTIFKGALPCVPKNGLRKRNEQNRNGGGANFKIY